MSSIEIVKPRLRSEVPAFVAGKYHAYEETLGTFPAQVVTRPAPGGPPLNSVALTSDRIIAFDTHGATEAIVALAFRSITGISTPEDAAQGRVTCVGSDVELDLAELAADDAHFLQDVLYHAAAGRLYRAGPPPD